MINVPKCQDSSTGSSVSLGPGSDDSGRDRPRRAMMERYGYAAPLYLAAGWRGVLPLPPSRKLPPPKGLTGYSGVDPGRGQIEEWRRSKRIGNLCLRLPLGVVGLDVDAYDNRRGAETLRDLEARWGSLPPTWCSSSRDDGVSGIYLYRVPDGLVFVGEIGDNIEIIQHHHRFVIAWPSWKWADDQGTTKLRYVWYDPTGQLADRLPHPEELPWLG